MSIESQAQFNVTKNNELLASNLKSNLKQLLQQIMATAVVVHLSKEGYKGIDDSRIGWQGEDKNQILILVLYQDTYILHPLGTSTLVAHLPIDLTLHVCTILSMKSLRLCSRSLRNLIYRYSSEANGCIQMISNADNDHKYLTPNGYFFELLKLSVR